MLSISMSSTVEEKDNRIRIEEEFQADYIPELRPTIQTDNRIIGLEISKHSTVLKTLHNLSHRSIHNQLKGPIGVELLAIIAEDLDIWKRIVGGNWDCV